jgi:hypothetical protein
MRAGSRAARPSFNCVMAGVSPETFTMSYTDNRGRRVTAKPRLVMRVDCKHKDKALVVGTHLVLATVPWERSEAELWALARVAARAMTEDA